MAGTIKVTQLTLKTGEKIIVSADTGANIVQSIQKKADGNIVLREHDNRTIQKFYIVDVKNIWVPDLTPQKDNLLAAPKVNKFDPNAPGYIAFLKAKQKLIKKFKA